MSRTLAREVVSVVLDFQQRQEPPDIIIQCVDLVLTEYINRLVQVERFKIEQAARAIRADYTEDVFPFHLGAAGARLAIDRFLATLADTPDNV